ncbi:MAG: helix-turn-helix transcriptional regulator [Spirochaetia bacterium]|nr:helix-turn-helix transcriptional regulator [Spirochaetia bacterium]
MNAIAPDSKAPVLEKISRMGFHLDEVHLAVRPAGWRRPESVFGDCHFWWIENGSGEIRINNTRHPVAGGELFLIRPGDRVAARVDDRKSVRVYFVPFIPAEPWLWESLRIASPIRTIPGELASLFREAEKHLSSVRKKGSSTALGVKIFFLRLLELLAVHRFIEAPARGSGDRAFAALEKLTAFIEKKPEKNFSLDELASAIGVERSTVIRLFKKFLNTTPSRWQSERRLERARALLAEAHPIAETARKTGFQSAAGLSRAFKARYHLSPELYSKGRMSP